jgi:hypothetical protein
MLNIFIMQCCVLLCYLSSFRLKYSSSVNWSAISQNFVRKETVTFMTYSSQVRYNYLAYLLLPPSPHIQGSLVLPQSKNDTTTWE